MFRLSVICDILGYEHSTTQDLFQKYYDRKFTDCNIWGAFSASSKNRHKRDYSCRNISQPRPRKRAARARTTCSETRHETVSDGQPVFSFQQDDNACADFKAVEVLSQMKTYRDQQSNESLPTEPQQPSGVYPNDSINGACNQNSSKGTV